VTYADFPNTFGFVDASPVFVQMRYPNQNNDNPGIYEAYNIKMQVLVTAGGELIYLAPVYYTFSHDQTMFDDSHVVRSLTTSAHDGPERKVILAD
jgi:hypothetical protein